MQVLPSSLPKNATSICSSRSESKVSEMVMSPLASLRAPDHQALRDPEAVQSELASSQRSDATAASSHPRSDGMNRSDGFMNRSDGMNRSNGFKRAKKVPMARKISEDSNSPRKGGVGQNYPGTASIPVGRAKNDAGSEDPDIRRNNALREALLEMDIVSQQVQRTRAAVESKRGLELPVATRRYDVSWGNLVIPAEDEELEEADLDSAEQQFLEDKARMTMEDELMQCCQPNMSTLRPLVDLLPLGFEDVLLQDHHHIMDYFALKLAIIERRQKADEPPPLPRPENDDSILLDEDIDISLPRVPSKRGLGTRSRGLDRSRNAAGAWRGVVLTHGAMQKFKEQPSSMSRSSSLSSKRVSKQDKLEPHKPGTPSLEPVLERRSASRNPRNRDVSGRLPPLADGKRSSNLGQGGLNFRGRLSRQLSAR